MAAIMEVHVVEAHTMAPTKALSPTTRSTHVQRVRSLPVLAAASSPSVASDFDLTALPDDILLKIVSFSNGSALERHREALKLASTCWALHEGLHGVISTLAYEAGSYLLVSKCGSDGLLNLSGMRIGRFECQLIARAMSRGMLPAHAATLWLQHNDIDVRGLRWLARGFQAIPATCSLRSVSLGANAFHRQTLNERHQEHAQPHLPPSLVRAMDQITTAANARGIKLRLNS